MMLFREDDPKCQELERILVSIKGKVRMTSGLEVVKYDYIKNEVEDLKASNIPELWLYRATNDSPVLFEEKLGEKQILAFLEQ